MEENNTLSFNEIYNKISNLFYTPEITLAFLNGNMKSIVINTFNLEIDRCKKIEINKGNKKWICIMYIGNEEIEDTLKFKTVFFYGSFINICLLPNNLYHTSDLNVLYTTIYDIVRDCVNFLFKNTPLEKEFLYHAIDIITHKIISKEIKIAPLKFIEDESKADEFKKLIDENSVENLLDYGLINKYI